MSRSSTVRQLLSLLRAYRWGFPAIVVLGLLQSLSEGIGIGLFIPLLTGLVTGAPTQARGQWLVDTLEGFFQGISADRRMAIILLCIFGAVLTTALLHYLHSILVGWLDGKIAHDLRRRIFRQLMTVNLGFMERDRSGRLLNILATETWNTNEALRLVVHIIIIGTTVVVYAALLLMMSWRLTLIVTAGMLLISGTVRLLTRAGRGLGEHVKEANAELADRMIEGIDGMKVIRAFGQEHREQIHFDAASTRLRRIMLRMTLLDAIVHPVHEVLAASLLLALLFLAAPSAQDVSVLLVFAFVLYRVQPRVKQFDAARFRLAALSASVTEVFSLLETSDKEYVTSGAVSSLALDRDIVFNRVSFHYDPGDAPALVDASFSILAGGTTAFVGPSGGGKSTVMKLLMRFNDPTTGTISVDGQPLQAFDIDFWRRQIAFVSQDVYLFNTTVRANIAYGLDDVGMDQIVDAARQADAHEFIERLPDKYDTVLGPHGVRLSGGQQQRISVARAIIRNPRILILDEATNALDSISEQWIQDTLDRLRKDRTVIMIAQRLSTVERADRIIVLEQGRVQECGTLSELVDAAGLFARLYHLQHRPSAASNG